MVGGRISGRAGDQPAAPRRRRASAVLAPLPEWLENVGLNLVWTVVAINLVGTAFGFWYYGFHPLTAVAAR